MLTCSWSSPQCVDGGGSVCATTMCVHPHVLQGNHGAYFIKWNIATTIRVECSSSVATCGIAAPAPNTHTFCGQPCSVCGVAGRC